MNFVELMALADKAINYIGEGTRLVGELQTNYADAKAALSEDEQAALEAKLADVRAKSAEVHSAVQAQP